MGLQGAWIVKTMQKNKNKVGGLTLPDWITYSKPTIIKTVWHWHENRCLDQWNRTESLEINQYIHNKLIFSMSAKAIHFSWQGWRWKFHGFISSMFKISFFSWLVEWYMSSILIEISVIQQNILAGGTHFIIPSAHYKTVRLGKVIIIFMNNIKIKHILRKCSIPDWIVEENKDNNRETDEIWKKYVI